MIRGSIAAIVTPMNAASEVDEQGLARLIDLHLHAGSDALLVAGTTGAGASLGVDGYTRLIRRVVERVQGEIPLIASIDSNSPREAIALSLAARHAGADALLITPDYLPLAQHGLYGHFEAIARAVDLPQILHHGTGAELSVTTVARLSLVANIIGIKDASGDLQRARQLLERCAPGFALYAGDDSSALEVMLLGGAGSISATASIAPRLAADMCEALRRGDARTAMQLDSRLRAARRAGHANQSAPGQVAAAPHGAERRVSDHRVRCPEQPIRQPCSTNPLVRANDLPMPAISWE